MRGKLLVVAVVLGALLSGTTPAAAVDDPAAAQPEFNSGIVLFRGNHQESLNGVSYHTFRIPAITRTNAGTLLAFAEGRVASNRDYGNINLLYKRSTDNGVNWSGLREAVGAGMGTWGNPTPVVDRSTGTVWLFLSWNAADKSNSASTEVRTMMRVRISYDDARTWPVSRPLSEAVAVPGAGTEGGYASMTKTADFRVGALIESNLNVNNSARSIIFRKVNLSWILHGCAC